MHLIFEVPQYTKWRSLRENEDSRYLGLILPRFLLRLPDGENTTPAKTFSFTETTDDNEEFCWGNTSYTLASRIADSFAKFRWCSNIIGPQSGGAVENLPLYQFEHGGEIQTKISIKALNLRSDAKLSSIVKRLKANSGVELSVAPEVTEQIVARCTET